MSRKERIEHQLTTELSPFFLSVEDESSHHHFKVTVVCEKFTTLNRVARHRLVQGLLSKEFDLGLHALSLHLYTKDESATASPRSSPSCKDGYKNKLV